MGGGENSYLDENNERYDFTWKGKSESIKIAQTPSEGTLRPIKKDSKNWKTTENLYIEGDNLEVLKLLQKTYFNKIKMIYIDPPYNTGKDFVYEDNFKDNLKNYLKQNEEGFNISSNPETSGRYHTNWLNMMFRRLKLARNLLREDGVLFISIDEHELHNLKKVCDEIFGEYNYIAQINWKGRNGRQDSKYFAIVNEYILCYGKNIDSFVAGEEIKIEDNYPKIDEKTGRKYKTQLLRKWGSNSRREDRPNLFYPIHAPDGELVYPMLSKTEEGCWRWGKSSMEKNIKEGKVEFVKKNDEWVPYEKIFEPLEGKENTKKYTTWIDNINQGNGSKLLKKIFNEAVFDYPKPIELIERLMDMGNLKDNDIVLDFFSGSGTTANAILDRNIKNKNNLRYILVQLPEETDEKSKAKKAGYENICEIGKERIRRAGETLIEEHPDADIDIGFKVFKLDSSNLNKWNPDVDNLEDSLINVRDNIVEGRTELDLVYEIMLKYGLELTLPVEEIKTDNYIFFSVGMGSLVVCLNGHIKRDVATDILAIKEDLSPNIMRVVFKDNGFESDSDKTNVKEILRNNEVDEFITI